MAPVVLERRAMFMYSQVCTVVREVYTIEIIDMTGDSHCFIAVCTVVGILECFFWHEIEKLLIIIIPVR